MDTKMLLTRDAVCKVTSWLSKIPSSICKQII